MPTLFASESDMQKWLSSALENGEEIADLIVNEDSLKSEVARNFAESRILHSFNTCISSLYLTTKLSENENISISEGDILKPDFVRYAPETESIVIVELKNIPGPTRQAGTELAAYSCEIKATIPFLSDGDIVHVLISTEWPTLLRHFVMHEIFWQSRNLICLKPVASEGGKVGLRILSLSEISEDPTSFKIGKEYIGGYQICLYDDNLYSKNSDRKRLDKYIEQFKAALNSMATTGNRLNSHGFAFLWKDIPGSLAPYSITVLNFAPFRSVERFLRIYNGELPEMVQRFIQLVREYDPEGHGNTLSTITDACTDLLGEVCSPRPEGFTTWGALREAMEGRAKHIAFVGWGIFGEAYMEKLKATYRQGNTSCSSTDPDLGLTVISEIVDENYEFIDVNYMYDDELMDEPADEDYDELTDEPADGS